MNLPDAIRTAIEAHIGDSITNVRGVGGGCISNATHVRTSNGRDLFLKWGSDRALFHAEADALSAMRDTNTVRVPAVVAIDDWLLTEWLEPGPITKTGWEQLGQSLAAMHRHRANRFGGPSPNFIGSLPQSNAESDDWPAFWRDERIVPQLHGLGIENRRRIEKLFEHVAEDLSTGNQEGASLLHGDLWNGNVHGVKAGAPALIDPSGYYGHREVDLAMAALFGGLDQRFFDAYDEVWPLAEGHERRRHHYQLYYMLVHVNLFGGGYLSGTISLVGKLGF